MKYYLLSEQDLDCIFWELENLFLELRERIEDKQIRHEEEREEDIKL